MNRGRSPPSRSRRLTLTWAVPFLFAAALTLAVGPPGLAIAILAAIPWLAWRHDNASGTFLVLAVLFLIATGVPALLLALLAVTH